MLILWKSVFTWYNPSLFIFLGYVLCSVYGTEIRGNTTICPGDSGIFECKTTNTEQLFWSINGSTILFTATHRVEDGPIVESGHIATLVEIYLTGGNVGNRTSWLRVSPTATITSLSCSGGEPTDISKREIYFIGNT